MSHSYLWEFNMNRCCDMQLDTLTARLEYCKEMGIEKNHTVSPDYPAAPNEDHLFDCMNLYATMQEDGTVEVEGSVTYWYSRENITRKTTLIRTFKNLDECLEWLSNHYCACRDCVQALDENC